MEAAPRGARAHASPHTSSKPLTLTSPLPSCSESGQPRERRRTHDARSRGGRASRAAERGGALALQQLEHTESILERAQRLRGAMMRSASNATEALDGDGGRRGGLIRGVLLIISGVAILLVVVQLARRRGLHAGTAGRRERATDGREEGEELNPVARIDAALAREMQTQANEMDTARRRQEEAQAEASVALARRLQQEDEQVCVVNSKSASEWTRVEPILFSRLGTPNLGLLT